jgi:integrase/recombinase XerC
MQVAHAREQYVRWLRITRDLSPHTIRAYDGDIAAFERHLGVRASVKVIDRDRLIAFMEAQRDAGLASASIRRRASGLRGFCRWLVSKRLLKGDPWVGTTVAAGRSRKLPRLLSGHDLRQLMATARTAGRKGGVGTADLATPKDPHEATTLLAIGLMITTGVRVNEVAAIRCGDLDLPSRSLRILGKGRRERQVYLTNEWITELTRAQLSTRESLGVAHEYLLFNRRLGPLTPASMRARLGKVARRAGISTRVTPHMLRHTAATQLIEAGVDIRYIQRLLGHASLSTTEIYTHVTNPVLQRVVSEADVLGGVLGQR